MITLKDAQTLLPHLSEDELRAWREPYTVVPVKGPVVARPFHGIVQVPELQGHYSDPPKDMYSSLDYYDLLGMARSLISLTTQPKGSISQEEAWSLFVFLMHVGTYNPLPPNELVSLDEQSDWKLVVQGYFERFFSTSHTALNHPHQHSSLLCVAGYLLREIVEWGEFKSYLEELASCIAEQRYAQLTQQDELSEESRHNLITSLCQGYNDVMCHMLRGYVSHQDLDVAELESLVELCIDCDHTIENVGPKYGRVMLAYRMCHIELLALAPVKARVALFTEWFGRHLDRTSFTDMHNVHFLRCLVWLDDGEHVRSLISMREWECFDEDLFTRVLARFGDECASVLLSDNRMPPILSDSVLSFNSEFFNDALSCFWVRDLYPSPKGFEPLSLDTEYPERLISLLCYQLAKPDIVWPLLRDRLFGLAQRGHIELIKQAIITLDEPMQRKVREHVLEPFDAILPKKSWPADAKRWFKIGQDREALAPRWKTCANRHINRFDAPVELEHLQVIPMLELQSGGYLPSECTLGFMVHIMESETPPTDKIKARYTAHSLGRLCWCVLFHRSGSTISLAEEEALSPYWSPGLIDYTSQRWWPYSYAPFEYSLNPYKLYKVREYGEGLRKSSAKEQHIEWRADLAKRHKMTQDELEDLSVWDFGLNAQGKRLFSYGEREFELSLSGPEVTLRDVQKQAIIKNLPPKKKGDDPELVAQAKALYKSIDKPLKAELIKQGERLEEAMLFKRMWTFGKAQDTLFTHPVFAALTSSLIWVMPSKLKRGTSKGMFRVTQDGSLIDVEMNDVKVSSRAKVRIAHPTDLAGVISAWAEHLTSFALVQPFAQLDHKVFVKNDETERAFKQFLAGERVLSCEALQALEKQGLWSIEWSGGSRYTAKRAHYVSLLREGEQRFQLGVEPFRLKATQTKFLGWREVDSRFATNKKPLTDTSKGLSSEVFSALLTLLHECELK